MGTRLLGAFLALIALGSLVVMIGGAAEASSCAAGTAHVLGALAAGVAFVLSLALGVMAE